MSLSLKVNPPTSFEFLEYYLEPIKTDIVVEDWQTLTTNAETIVATRGGGSENEWPFICSLEENYKDLAWLEICSNYKQLFSYVIRGKYNRYVGCIYIYPIDLFYSDLKDKYDIDFTFWIVEDLFENGEYKPIYDELISWLVNTWQFDRDRIYFRNKLKV